MCTMIFSRYVGIKRKYKYIFVFSPTHHVGELKPICTIVLTFETMQECYLYVSLNVLSSV